MNEIEGHITEIVVSGNLSLVSARVADTLTLKAIVIETPETVAYLQKGRQVRLMFKDTEVVLGSLEDHRISLQNRIKGRVTSVEKGRLLSRVRIDSEVGEIQSVISTQSAERLGLRENSDVYAMIKLNEMMLAE